MKAKLFISSLLVLLTLAAGWSVFNGAPGNTSFIPPGPQTNHFLIGAMSAGWQTNYSKLTDTLHFNMWHRYISGGISGGQFYINGWTGNDYLDADINNYRTDIQSIIDTNNSHGMRTLMERPKITRLAFGERSDYQCESANLNNGLEFYAYSNHNALDENTYDSDPNYGSNSWVRHCMSLSPEAPSHVVVSGLLANREQVNMDGRWEGDRSYGWIVKPRIRADKNYIMNHDDEPICRIEVINYDNNLIKSVEIRARHFKDQQSGLYDGHYKEDGFNFDQSRGDSTLEIPQPQAINFNPRGADWYVPDGTCHVDFRVYWYRTCEMWIDYVRVDNEIANDLLSTNPNNTQHQVYENWLQWEAQDIGLHTSSPYKFYIEEFEFNNIPCMSYVSRRLKSYNANIGLMCDLNYSNYNTMLPFPDWDHVPNMKVDHVKRYLIDSVGSTEILMGAYPFAGFPREGNFGAYSWSKIPNTLPCGDQAYNANTGMLAYTVSTDEYDRWLQEQLDETSVPYWSYRLWSARADSLSKSAGIPYINMFQTHLWWGKGHRLKEPTNEELELTSNLALSYGARGIFYFWYDGWGDIPRSNDTDSYGRGLTDPIPTHNPNPFEALTRTAGVTYEARTLNVYGQNKWQKIIDINNRLMNNGENSLGPYFANFDNDNRHTYISRLVDEDRVSMLNPAKSYFKDIVTYKRGSGNIECMQDSPESTYTGPGNPPLMYECAEDRYLQVTTFNTMPGIPIQYFMIVNRRCSPLRDDHNDGERYIRVRFHANSQYLPTYTNWNITDLSTGSVAAQFSGNVSELVDLRWFSPGEGKLYKISPVLVNGGTLIADENISGTTLICESNVYNNGHNITIGTNTHISFTDTSKIIMTGGTFTVGNPNTNGSQNITFDSHTGSNWHGYDFNTCEVKIYNSSFSKTANDTISAISLIDCPVVDIRGNAFSTGDNTLQGCINAVYYNYVTTLNQNFYIGGNTFNSNNSTVPAFSVSDYAGITMPVLIENNTYTSTSSGTTAILLSGITSGAVKSNTVTDYSIGLNMLSASADIFNNTISSSISGSIGIYGTAGSELNMNASGDVMLGGLNNISFTDNSSKDILVENSFFDICYGQNVFNVFDADASKHLAGYFPYSDGSYKPDAEDNCFKVNGAVHLPPLHNVLNGYEGQPIDISFDPYLSGCTQQDQQSEYIISLGGGIYDTVGLRGGGNGGGYPVKKEEAVIVTPKQVYDSISEQMRKHNYTAAKTKCFSMIDMFTDSIESLGAISKLYLAVIASDSSQSAAANLKTYYETLILNHANNVSLVRRCNYFVQKCKVRMHQYSSAMTGFNEIMNQNPYSYEGLLARWDYMATSLLVNGQGGGDNGISEFDKSDESDKFDNPDGDKSPFTKKERSTIKQNVITALETTKKRDTEKIKILQERSETGDETAKHELKIANTLKEIVKSEKPKNIIQHIKIVSGDVQKIFGSSGKSISKIQNSIPTVFKLYQNYPNPFNPVCVIKYDLPRDVKTVIKIYDILGREVKILVNEFKKAGAYTINFDGTMYASGVYFYRIEAGDFVESKKMVMVK